MRSRGPQQFSLKPWNIPQKSVRIWVCRQRLPLECHGVGKKAVSAFLPDSTSWLAFAYKTRMVIFQISGLPGTSEFCWVFCTFPTQGWRRRWSVLEALCTKGAVSSTAPFMRLHCTYDPEQKDPLKSNKDEGQGRLLFLDRPQHLLPRKLPGSATGWEEDKWPFVFALCQGQQDGGQQGILDSPFSPTLFQGSHLKAFKSWRQLWVFIAGGQGAGGGVKVSLIIKQKH